MTANRLSVICTSFGRIVSVALAAVALSSSGWGQVNSGSNGSDGAFNPTTSVVIDMADHPTGIYQYASVNIPAGVTVSFVPNANNAPVVWLVQGSCVIAGSIVLSGQNAGQNGFGTVAGIGGPGGYNGGQGGGVGSPSGQGPGGGGANENASYGNLGGGTTPGAVYGNTFLLPLLGGSGGGGGTGGGGGGGGGALLIASSGTIHLAGSIYLVGGGGAWNGSAGGGGSGGGVRLISQVLSGTGSIVAWGGVKAAQFGSGPKAGDGRVRIDTLDNQFSGSIIGVLSQGFQPIILPVPGQGAQLAIVSVAGLPIGASPTGVISSPDVVIPGQQANPVSIAVRCSNIPLNSQITVSVRPVNGATVSAATSNSAGTPASSTATASLNIPRGGGLIYATAVIAVGQGASLNQSDKFSGYAGMGLTTDGERFVKVEITAALGNQQRTTFITQSGKRYSLATK